LLNDFLYYIDAKNSGIIAILINLVAALLLKLSLLQPSKIFRIINSCIITICLVFIIFLGSRTAILAFLTVSFYIFYPIVKSKYYFKVFTNLFLILFFFSVLFFIFFYKLQSTYGRAFVYKISWKLLRKNWISGVGHGKFNIHYNHAQASYFSNHSITDDVALRADDGYYALNEWMQIWIENGLFAFLLFTLLTALLVIISIKRIKRKYNFAELFILVVLIACLFSYPLHNYLIRNLFILCVVIVLVSFSVEKIRLKKRNFLFKVVVASLSVILIGITLATINDKHKIKTMESLIESGDANEALIFARSNWDRVSENYKFSGLYLKLLFDTHRLDEYLSFFEKNHFSNCNQRFHTMAGHSYNEVGDSLSAEKNFLIALYIAPYRLQSRKDLMDFYHQRGNIRKARFWANEIIVCPMKFYTDRGVYLKNKATAYLKAN